MSVDLNGYVTVDERLREFFEKYPEGRMRPVDPARPFWIERIPDGSGQEHTYVCYAAAAYRTPDDPAPAIGLAYEQFPGRTNFTRTSELMNAETSAWGRALAALGIGIKGKIATRDEVYAATQRREPEQGGGFQRPQQTQERTVQELLEAAYDADGDDALRGLWREAGAKKLNSEGKDPEGSTVILGDVIKGLRAELKRKALKRKAADGAGSDAA